MFLLVGLGNYGKEYLTTKHNYGFLLIDKIIARYKFIEQKNKFQSDFGNNVLDRIEKKT